jgi:virulence-associated protein VapD
MDVATIQLKIRITEQTSRRRWENVWHDMMNVLDQLEGIGCGLSQMKQGSITVSKPAERRVDKNILMSMFVMARPGVGVDEA